VKSCRLLSSPLTSVKLDLDEIGRSPARVEDDAVGCRCAFDFDIRLVGQADCVRIEAIVYFVEPAFFALGNGVTCAAAVSYLEFLADHGAVDSPLHAGVSGEEKKAAHTPGADDLHHFSDAAEAIFGVEFDSLAVAELGVIDLDAFFADFHNGFFEREGVPHLVANPDMAAEVGVILAGAESGETDQAVGQFDSFFDGFVKDLSMDVLAADDFQVQRFEDREYVSFNPVVAIIVTVADEDTHKFDGDAHDVRDADFWNAVQDSVDDWLGAGGWGTCWGTRGDGGLRLRVTFCLWPVAGARQVSAGRVGR